MIPIISSILGIAKSIIPDKNAQLEFEKKLLEHKSDIEKQFVKYANLDHELRMKEINTRGFKAWWRPALMFGFGIIVFLYGLIYYIVPGVLVYFPIFDYAPLIEAPKVDPALWDLVKYSVLGLGGMRTIDKWRSK